MVLPSIPTRESVGDTHGDGERAVVTLVLLPGMDGTGLLFEPLVAALGARYPCHVVRYPTSQPLDYEALTAMARDAIPAQGPFVLVGESFSGPIAIALAAQGSPRLKGVILCCTFVRNPLPSLAFLSPTLACFPLQLVSIRAMVRVVLGSFFSWRLSDTLVRAIRQMSVEVLRARLKAVLAVDVSLELDRIKVPLLYLRASQDRLVPKAASQQVVQSCAPVREVVLRGPHFLLQASPHEAVVAMDSFLQSLEKPMAG